MGSSSSSIADDEDDYHWLCKKYGEKPRDVYSNHYYWLKDVDDHKTKLSFKEYDKDRKEKKLKMEIEYKERKLQKLKEQLKTL